MRFLRKYLSYHDKYVLLKSCTQMQDFFNKAVTLSRQLMLVVRTRFFLLAIFLSGFVQEFSD